MFTTFIMACAMLQASDVKCTEWRDAFGPYSEYSQCVDRAYEMMESIDMYLAVPSGIPHTYGFKCVQTGSI